MRNQLTTPQPQHVRHLMANRCGKCGDWFLTEDECRTHEQSCLGAKSAPGRKP